MKATTKSVVIFVIFVMFLSLTTLMTQFVQMIDRVLSSYALLTNSFIPADILQPWQGRWQK
jgi:hypothetical protein